MGSEEYVLAPSTRDKKKWMITTPNKKKVHFGQKGASDYTKHKDPERKEKYISRHAGSDSGNTSSREDWTKSGLDTAGFWSRWLLWGEKTIDGSINAIETKFNIKIKKEGDVKSPRMPSKSLLTTSKVCGPIKQKVYRIR